MSDVFGRSIQYGGGFKPEGTTVNFSGITGGAIVRNVNIGYEQPMTRIWDLSSSRCFFVAGHTNGTWGIGKIAGTGATLAAISGYNVCSPGTMSFTGKNGLCKAGQATYKLHHVVTTNIAVAVSSEDMVLTEGLGGSFLSLDVG